MPWPVSASLLLELPPLLFDRLRVALFFDGDVAVVFLEAAGLADAGLFAGDEEFAAEVGNLTSVVAAELRFRNDLDAFRVDRLAANHARSGLGRHESLLRKARKRKKEPRAARGFFTSLPSSTVMIHGSLHRFARVDVL